MQNRLSNGCVTMYFSAPSEGNEDLLHRLLERQDQASFALLFKNYYPILCRQALALLRCQQRAEEAVSDVFVKVWQNKHLLDVSTKAIYYLSRAVRNQAVDYLRKEARDRRNHERLLAEVTLKYQNCPQYAMEVEECHEKVEAAISTLPPQGQQIFRLSREEGLKYREIAELLGLSVKTVETHMRRSLIHLRAFLADDLAA